MSHPRLIPTLLALGILAGCSDQLTQPGVPRNPTAPSFAIVDGAHGGNQQFYFLPPLVPAPSYSGTFDATQSPVVQICELTGTACGAIVASFSGSAVKVDLTAEAYGASWKTKGAGLDPAKTYRIQVLVGANVLGYADVVVLSNGSQIKTVDKDQFVSVINGGVLKIRFRIEAGPPPPPPGQWQNGDLVTYTQVQWGDPAAAAGTLLNAQFNSVYASTGVLEVGLNGAAGFSILFSGSGYVHAYLPAIGNIGALNADLIDPTSTSAGAFGGEVTALQLNVDFADAGHTLGSSGLRFGDLTLCGYTDLPALNGRSVRQFLAYANSALGGGSAPYTIAVFHLAAEEINASFAGGVVSAFAQDHLVNGACPGGWQNGALVTYSQDAWGGDPTTNTAAALLLNRFNSRYPGGIEVGLLLGAGFSMFFTSAAAVFDFLPASGTYGALNADLIDPTSSASGAYGGFVLALKLSVDFTDSGDLGGSSGLAFGDLRLCGLTTTPAYNNLTVRQFLAAMNTALGGGLAAYSFDEMANLTNDVSLAFEGGTPSSFAQAYLVNGACPGGWQNGQIITHTQLDWGDPVSSAGILLYNQYDFVYFGTGGVLEVGILGSGGFSMAFTSATALLAYLPAIGNIGALNADLIDPTTTASGAFGGEVVALKVNIDFAAAGHTVGSSGLQFGSLTLCAFPTTPALNGISVNDFLTMLNSALGGGPAPYTISELHLITEQVNAAFSNGSPTLFAQVHFVNGPCP